MNQCKTCHWWFTHREPDNFGLCVFLNGMRGERNTPLKSKGTIRVREDFGCNCWEAEQRKRVK